MTFYGIPDKAKADRVYELLTEIRAIYGDVPISVEIRGAGVAG